MSKLEPPQGKTRDELEHLIKIAHSIGRLYNAIEWLSAQLESYEPEPDWHKDKLRWVKWYRRVHGGTVKDAVDEGKRRYS